MEQKHIRNVNDELPRSGFLHQYYRHHTGFLYTSRVQYVIEAYRCGWFVEVIMKGWSFNGCPLDWKMKRLFDNKFRLTCHNHKQKLIWQREIHSAFVADEISFVFTDEMFFDHKTTGLLLLSNEY